MLDKRFINIQFTIRMVISSILAICCSYYLIQGFRVAGFDGLGYGLISVIIAPFCFSNLVFPLIARILIRPTKKRVIVYRILMTLTYLADLFGVICILDKPVRHWYMHSSSLNCRYYILGIIGFVFIAVNMYFTYRKKLLVSVEE